MDISHFEAKVALGESLSLKEQQLLLEEIACLQELGELQKKTPAPKGIDLKEIKMEIDDLRCQASSLESDLFNLLHRLENM